MMFPVPTVIGLAGIVVLVSLAAFGIFRIVNSKERLVLKVVLVALSAAAAGFGLLVLIYVFPAYWD